MRADYNDADNPDGEQDNSADAGRDQAAADAIRCHLARPPQLPIYRVLPICQVTLPTLVIGIDRWGAIMALHADRSGKAGLSRGLTVRAFRAGLAPEPPGPNGTLRRARAG